MEKEKSRPGFSVPDAVRKNIFVGTAAAVPVQDWSFHSVLRGRLLCGLIRTLFEN
jgi:hypothetical protein